MGLFDFFGGLLSKNSTEGQMANTPQFDYISQLQQLFGGGKNDIFSPFGSGAQQAQQINDMLMKTASGEGPNVGEMQQQAANSANNQAMAAGIAGSKGLTPALAAHIAANAAAGGAAQNAMNARTANAAERLGAAAQLSGNLNNQANSFTNRLGALGNLNNTQNQIQVQNSLGAQGLTAGAAKQNTEFNQGLAGGFLGGLGGVLGMGGQSSASPMMAGEGAPGGAGPSAPGSSWGIGALSYSDGGAVPNGGTTAPDPNKLNSFLEALNNDSSYRSGNKGGQGIAQMGKAALPLLAMASEGGDVPGKAKVKGDSTKNDNVPAMLSPGEIVIPRSKANPEDAKRFVEDVQKKKEREEVNFGHVLHANRVMHERLANLERMAYGGMCG